MMREGKPELYFLLILYQKFFDLSNPNFGNVELCGVPPCGRAHLVGRYVAAFSGNSRYGVRSLDAQEKLRIALGCGKSVRGVRPRPAENPNPLVYHISVNLSIGKIKKRRGRQSSSSYSQGAGQLGSAIQAPSTQQLHSAHFISGNLQSCLIFFIHLFAGFKI